MPEISWKNYLITGVFTTAAVATGHAISAYTNCPVANEWYTLGTAGAIGSLVISHEQQHHQFTDGIKRLFKRN